MRIGFLIPFAASIFVGCSAEDSAGWVEPGESETLKPTACRFVVPSSVEGTAVKCYDVIVPERHDVPNSRTIKIHVARLPGQSDLPPTIELNGGPGAPSDPVVGLLAAGEPSVVEQLGFLRERGDYVFFDQRGVGRSEPNIACAEVMVAATPGTPVTDVVTRCKDDLTAQGIDVAAYTTYESARDVDDIRKAFGWSTVDLHGASYGSLLALEILRQRPETVRAAIIDAVLPPDAKLYTDRSHNHDAVLTRIFAACAAQPACKAAFPDLEGSLALLSKRLSEQGDVAEGELTLSALQNRLANAMYTPEGVRQIPVWVHELAARGADAYKEILEKEAAAKSKGPFASTDLGREVMERWSVLDSNPVDQRKFVLINNTAYRSILCSDSLQYEDANAAVLAQKDVRLVFQDESGVKEGFEICNLWPKGERRDTTKQVVASNVPTLALGGEFDGITPATDAERAARTLARGQFLLQKGLAHGSLDGCARQQQKTFFKDPLAKVDPSCSNARTLMFATSFADEGPIFTGR